MAAASPDSTAADGDTSPSFYSQVWSSAELDTSDSGLNPDSRSWADLAKLLNSMALPPLSAAPEGQSLLEVHCVLWKMCHCQSAPVHFASISLSPPTVSSYSAEQQFTRQGPSGQIIRSIQVLHATAVAAHTVQATPFQWLCARERCARLQYFHLASSQDRQADAVGSECTLFCPAPPAVVSNAWTAGIQSELAPDLQELPSSRVQLHSLKLDLTPWWQLPFRRLFAVSASALVGSPGFPPLQVRSQGISTVAASSSLPTQGSASFEAWTALAEQKGVSQGPNLLSSSEGHIVAPEWVDTPAEAPAAAHTSLPLLWNRSVTGSLVPVLPVAVAGDFSLPGALPAHLRRSGAQTVESYFFAKKLAKWAKHHPARHPDAPASTHDIRPMQGRATLPADVCLGSVVLTDAAGTHTWPECPFVPDTAEHVAHEAMSAGLDSDFAAVSAELGVLAMPVLHLGKALTSEGATRAMVQMHGLAYDASIAFTSAAESGGMRYRKRGAVPTLAVRPDAAGSLPAVPWCVSAAEPAEFSFERIEDAKLADAEKKPLVLGPSSSSLSLFPLATLQVLTWASGWHGACDVACVQAPLASHTSFVQLGHVFAIPFLADMSAYLAGWATWGSLAASSRIPRPMLQSPLLQAAFVHRSFRSLHEGGGIPDHPDLHWGPPLIAEPDDGGDTCALWGADMGDLPAGLRDAVQSAQMGWGTTPLIQRRNAAVQSMHAGLSPLTLGCLSPLPGHAMTRHDNERFEKIGDAVLEVVLRHAVWSAWPSVPQETLRAWVAVLAQNETLHGIAQHYLKVSGLVRAAITRNDRTDGSVVSQSMDAFAGMSLSETAAQLCGAGGHRSWFSPAALLASENRAANVMGGGYAEEGVSADMTSGEADATGSHTLLEQLVECARYCRSSKRAISGLLSGDALARQGTEKDRCKFVADAVEALVACVWLEQGWTGVLPFVRDMYAPHLAVHPCVGLALQNTLGSGTAGQWVGYRTVAKRHCKLASEGTLLTAGMEALASDGRARKAVLGFDGSVEDVMLDMGDGSTPLLQSAAIGCVASSPSHPSFLVLAQLMTQHLQECAADGPQSTDSGDEGGVSVTLDTTAWGCPASLPAVLARLAMSHYRVETTLAELHASGAVRAVEEGSVAGASSDVSMVCDGVPHVATALKALGWREEPVSGGESGVPMSVDALANLADIGEAVCRLAVLHHWFDRYPHAQEDLLHAASGDFYEQAGVQARCAAAARRLGLLPCSAVPPTSVDSQNSSDMLQLDAVDSEVCREWMGQWALAWLRWIGDGPGRGHGDSALAVAGPEGALFLHGILLPQSTVRLVECQAVVAACVRLVVGLVRGGEDEAGVSRGDVAALLGEVMQHTHKARLAMRFVHGGMCAAVMRFLEGRLHGTGRVLPGAIAACLRAGQVAEDAMWRCEAVAASVASHMQLDLACVPVTVGEAEVAQVLPVHLDLGSTVWGVTAAGGVKALSHCPSAGMLSCLTPRSGAQRWVDTVGVVLQPLLQCLVGGVGNVPSSLPVMSDAPQSCTAAQRDHLVYGPTTWAGMGGGEESGVGLGPAVGGGVQKVGLEPDEFDFDFAAPRPPISASVVSDKGVDGFEGVREELQSGSGALKHGSHGERLGAVGSQQDVHEGRVPPVHGSGATKGVCGDLGDSDQPYIYAAGTDGGACHLESAGGVANSSVSLWSSAVRDSSGPPASHLARQVLERLRCRWMGAK